MHTKFLKRTIAILTCLALLTGCFAFSVVSAAADETEPQSEWAMTVPQIRVTTENGNGTTLQKADGYQNAAITITDTDGSMLSDSCLFKVRGNTTALDWVLKKAFTFKFEKKKDVLGMGKGKKWALIANAFDPTLLRNYTAFSLAKELGLAYTSEFRFVELWVDGVFRGCYLLMEPVQEGKDRVAIDIESNDGKNDFLIEYEAQRVEDDVTYFTVNGLRFISSEPEEPTEEQLAYIQSTMQDIIITIRTGTKEEIAAKIDVESFAKFFLLNETLKTFDFSVSSVFFYFQNSKLYAGPPWDYDLSMGNANPDFSARGQAANDPEGVFANKNIYKYLCRCDWFDDEVRKVFRDHYGFFSNLGADGAFLDTASAQYADIFARNYNEAGWKVAKWWINIQKMPLSSYDSNLSFLKEWCQKRVAWMTDYYKPNAEEYLFGDADGNGVINVNDATHIQRVLAESVTVEDTEALLRRADIDGNGLSINDVTLLQRWLAEFDSAYGIGEQRVSYLARN